MIWFWLLVFPYILTWLFLFISYRMDKEEVLDFLSDPLGIMFFIPILNSFVSLVCIFFLLSRNYNPDKFKKKLQKYLFF